MKNKENIKKMLFPNVETETLKRQWIRRYYVSLTEEHKQKCLYFIKLYGGNKNDVR